ncbi:hypothetical protein COCSADRAFT_290351 [Bipolaris sorokiniana ND90Pr]|uniref:Bacteriophage T5 Orf172 DNA-binding domain-containing protein n=1 Tax=Cochliobolus sativus (strain ND90Pr / ATCC 201652) TaxID=665912 RepID=M2TFN5_COCSN|nr:uncharacterized protein COCSADRAFT_290351 [Bipolaris sorokiniana ND90Pr]EMD67557.1 hypothetical protein COCSADRAFT_290351 [Bipolaris sorokiniana ND90Pr]
MFTGVTPESLIPRSDSRNPATTCKGLTQSGRPCKRPIDAKEPEGDGVLAVTSVAGDDSGEEIGAAAYFCWQHKDQAETLAAKESTGPATQLYPLKERSSIDTLVQRLGVLDIEEQNEVAPRKRRSSGHRRRSGSRPPRRINRPPTWDAVQGPLMSVPSDVMADRKRRDRPSKSAPPVKKLGFWASLCCGSADEEVTEPTRHKKKTEHQPPVEPTQTETPMQDIPQPQSQPPQPPRVQGQSRKSSSQHSRPSSSRKPLSEKPARPVNKSNNPSSDPETAALLRYIPTSVPPKLASTMLAELSKPISPHDEEGFIYIFWLTPETAGPAPASAASNLLAPRGEGSRRRTSDVMRQYSIKDKKGGGEKGGERGEKGGKDTILLKIGRANNVHRRMNEWTRQCGYSLSLVRYYPHVSSATPSPAGSRQASHQGRGPAQAQAQAQASSGGLQAGGEGAAAGVRKVPHTHRVERMIHLELGEQRVIKQCEACGKSHKEWFEVEATREGVKKVDEVVKRWVEWAEKRNE